MPRRRGHVCDAHGITCRLLWKLARRHGWGSPVPAEELVRSALESSLESRGRDRLDDLLAEPYVGRASEGIYLKNDPDSQALAALRLLETCGYSRLQVEATLSRFEQAGGFDAYDETRLRRRLAEWW